MQPSGGVLLARARPSESLIESNPVTGTNAPVFLDKGIFVSGGSACAKGKKSHVLSAMRLSPKNIDAALRISFCPENTSEDVQVLCDAIAML